VVLSDVSNDAEPQSGASRFASSARVDTIEALKDSLKVLGGNTNAVVFYSDADERANELAVVVRSRLDPFNRDRDGSAKR
jgi:hypothetical protein